MRNWNFNLERIIGRIIPELDVKINKFISSRKNRGERGIRADFFKEVEKRKIDFPIKKDTYYKYKRVLDENNVSKNMKTMRVDVFCDICKFTEVSPEYYLGLIDTKRKEQSAQKVREEFGLSDKSMETLSIINKNKPDFKGELSSQLMNFVLENQVFWNKINDRLPAYLSSINDIRTAEIDVEVARYSLIRAFEELLDDICDMYRNSPLPNEELNETSVFYL